MKRVFVAGLINNCLNQTNYKEEWVENWCEGLLPIVE